MRFRSLAPVLLTSALSLLLPQAVTAQPSMTSISPNYGGTGPNAPGSYTIAGTGFSTLQDGTRFVDNNNVDLFQYVSCSSSTSCSAFSVWGNRVAPGTIANMAIFALVNGTKSGSFAPFIYYGAPVVTSVTPGSGPSSGTSGITITGGAFTSGVSFPGMTSIYLQSNISDLANGCGSTTQCTNYTAPSLSVGVKTGPNNISLRTPGGSASPVFIYTPALATPSITGLNPNHGTSQGGQTITVAGSNFVTAANGTTFTFTTEGNSVQASNVVCVTNFQCSMTSPPGYGAADVTASTQTSTSFSATSASTSSSRFIYAGYAFYWPDGRGMTQVSNTYLSTSESGGQAQYRVALTTAPTSTVTIALTVAQNGGVIGTVSPATLTFTTANWSNPQLVTITGVDDNGVGGAPAQRTGNYGSAVTMVATSVDAAYNNFTGQVNFSNYDNESVGYYYSRTAQLVTTKNGGATTVQISLLKAPTSNVALTLTSNDPLAGSVSPASLLFDTTTGGATSWNTPRNVTITGAADSYPGNTPYAILVQATTVDPAYAAFGQPSDIYVTNAILAPTNLTATASSTTAVVLSWTGVTGAESYLVYRSTGGGVYTLVGVPTTAAFTDSGLTANTSYMYRVRAVQTQIASSDSAGDFATTTIFTNDPLSAGMVVQGVHLTEMRTAVNALRTLAGLTATTFTDTPLTGVPIKALHITQLRTALDGARAALGAPLLAYTNGVTAGTSVVKAVDFTEVRNGTK